MIAPWLNRRWGKASPPTMADRSAPGAEGGTGQGPAAGRLAAERDDLLARLGAVRSEHAAGDLDDDDAEALIDDLTARAADVLRRLEAVEAGRPDPGPGSGGAGAQAPSTAGGGGAARRQRGLVLAQVAGQRGTGETFTGDIRQTTRDLLLEARDLTAQGDVEGALAAYDEVLAIAPTNAEALTYSAWLGRTMLGALSDTEALLRLDDALASDPAYADAIVFRAIILRDLGRFDEALAALDALDPAAVPAFLAGRVSALREEVSGADPDTVAVLRAQALLREGDVVGATWLLDEVLARSPDNAPALVAKADLLLATASQASGEDRALLLGNALSVADRAAAAVPDDPVPVLYRVVILDALGRRAEARTTLGLLEVRADLSPEIRAEVEALRARLGS
jgi:Flp pilus assembly protein TadD